MNEAIGTSHDTMNSDPPELNLGETKEESLLAFLHQASWEVLNLAHTMALSGMPMGQRAWQDEVHRLHLGKDEEGTRLTGVRISAAMKVLKKKGLVEQPEHHLLRGVWMKRDFVIPILKQWAESDPKEMRSAVYARKTIHATRFRSRRYGFHHGQEAIEEELSALALCYGYGFTEQWQDLETLVDNSEGPDLAGLVARFLCDHFDWVVFGHFSDPFAGFLSQATFSETIHGLRDPKKLVEFLRKDRFIHSLRNLAELEILRGNFDEASRIAGTLLEEKHPLGRAYGSALLAWLAFLRGQDEQVVTDYEQALAAMVEGTRKKKAYPGGFSSPFALLGMVRLGDRAPVAKRERYAKWGVELGSDLGAPVVQKVEEFLRWSRIQDENLLEEYAQRHVSEFLYAAGETIDDLVMLLCVHWTAPELLVEQGQKIVGPLVATANVAGETGYRWIEMELSLLISQVTRDEALAKESMERAEALREGLDFPPVPLIDLAKPVPAWEKSIAKLESLFADPEAANTSKPEEKTADKQFLWGLSQSYYGHGFYVLPHERTILKSGKWSVPKKVSLQRLFDQFRGWSHLSDADQKIVEAFQNRQQNYWRGYMHEQEVTSLEGVFSLFDQHPAVFWNDGRPDLERPVRIVEIEPSVSLTENKKGVLSLEIHPYSPAFEVGDVFFQLLDNDILEYCRVTGTLRKLCDTFPTERSRKFPAEAKERISGVLTSLAGSIRVEGDATATAAEGAREIAADDTLRLRLTPHGEGLSVTTRVQPLGEDGPTFAPGIGSEVVFGRDDEGPLRAIRNLKEENRSLMDLVSRSATLSSHMSEHEPAWMLSDLESCLQLLLDLRELPEELQPVMEWPEGEAISLKALAGAESFSIRLNSRSDWLEASGELQIDENTVLTMQNLLRLMEDSASSRFIRLDDRQYIALTERLQRQLRDIGALSVDEPEGDDDSYRLPALTAHLIEDLAVEAKATTNTAWKRRLKKLKESAQLEPEVPPTLQAQLRPYQREGFEWLARLAHWTGGACLADDMGLGKTVQALALLLRRAADGPALIVAPVSVAANWADEAIRFAPTLNVRIFRGPNRNEALEELAPRDLVIVTYGLLQSESALFAGIEWITVVIDEAQAIKNRETLRYKAALRLRAKFRLITTGTPIENHLQELYNLFHFIQPGLLGNLSRFQQKFATPIEQHQSGETQDRLRRLIQPFILRRLKGDVLRDLPEKTEITLQVELSEEETAFYEALRRNAVETIETHADDKGAVRILAELMKLRRACCNPALVDPKSAPPSSKLKVFRDTLEELLSNGHKVLVFSQFVDHLALLREHLDDEEISYQYLDGSTTPKKRKTAIDAFQSGDGDVFLISLKAGGFGLNLTAADYVIHMDPWWNPAVEDQASDRAHRIGQTRPVTIYRLVASGTIEEKIVTLHHQKRELADSLLSGTDSATKLSVDQLKAILTDDA